MSNRKEKIMEAYTQLLDENPAKRVTVNDIVTRCGVSRNTFYYYFPDIPALVAEIEHRWAELIKEPSDAESVIDCLQPLVKYAMQHQTGVLRSYHSATQAHFLGSMNRIWDDAVRRFFDLRQNCTLSEDDRELLIRFFRSMFAGMTMDWLDADMSYDIIKAAERIWELMNDEQVYRGVLQSC